MDSLDPNRKTNSTESRHGYLITLSYFTLTVLEATISSSCRAESTVVEDIRIKPSA